jgi:hypothetical protein
MYSPTQQQESVVYHDSQSIKTSEQEQEQSAVEEECKESEEHEENNAAKEQFYHPKFEFLTSQLPLHSISEDINSPYFASSPSNITAYVRRQSTPNKELSARTLDQKFSSNDVSEELVSTDRNPFSKTIQTTTSVSDNFLETANIESLEQKLERIAKKRNKRIQIFENYLDQWEKEKFDNKKTIKRDQVKKKSPVKTRKYSVKKTSYSARDKNWPKKPANALKQHDSGLRMMNFSNLGPVLKTPKPVLSTRSRKATK